MVRRWIGSVVLFGRDCLSRFFEVQGLDRAMALAAQAFTTLLPLVVVYSTLSPTTSSRDFAARIIDRFELSGAAASSVKQAFAPTTTVEQSVTVLGFVVLIISALSFTRGLQRLFEKAHQLPALGMRGTTYGLQWLLVVGVIATVRPLVTTGLDGAGASILLLGFGIVLWLSTPYLLLGKRLPWRRLMPTAILTTIGMTIFTTGSVIYLPHAIGSLSSQFGFIGVAFAFVSWFFGAATVLVTTASVGAVIDDRRHR